MHGQFVWYELTTPDVEGARRFYPAFTGWSTQQFDKDYTMWTTGGTPFAGIFKLGPDLARQGVPPNWMPYVETNNVDETAMQATAAGGRIVVPAQDIPGTGRFAVLSDPQGAVFGIYKSSTGSRAWDGSPVVGRFSWHELMTTDHRGAYEFYRRLFGWEKQGEMDMGSEGGVGGGVGQNIYQMYGKAGKMFGGMYNRSAQMASVPPFWLLYIRVKDVNRAVETAKKGGAKLQNGPMQVPGGTWIAVLSDPQGAAFAVHGETAGASAAQATPAAKPAAKPASARKSSPARKAKPTRKASSARRAKPARKAARPAARTKARPKSKASRKGIARPKTRPKARARSKK
jgi:predicted enzyme related to lactoylglutathione lyase